MKPPRKYHSLCILLLTIGLLIFIASNVSSDCGVIPLVDTWLYQPSQNAIIAWNGNEEILILSTNIVSGENTTAIQIIPFPTYPEISKGNESSFYKIGELVRTIEYKHVAPPFGPFPAGYLAGVAEVEVLFTTTIGVHNLTVLKVNNAGEFTIFIKTNLTIRNQSLVEKFDLLFPNFENIANNYLERNIKYFVIDDINLKNNLRTVEPIIYRFNTSYLYYPTVMTSMIFDFLPKEYYGYYYHNYIAINIYTITQGIPHDEHIIKIGYQRRALLETDKNSLEYISPEIASLFSSNTWVGSYRARVDLTEAKASPIFNQDFTIRETSSMIKLDWLINIMAICGIVLTLLMGVYLLKVVRR
ncbi:MAG: DUF2330 domain-containing protein [Candidatus Thermoplasmatota archaeon]